MQLECPLDLEARQFNHIYENEMDVFEISDLSVKVPDDAPCINVLIRGALECKPSRQVHKPKSDGCSPINLNTNNKQIHRKSH